MHHSNQPSATWRRGWRLSMSHVTSTRACRICQLTSAAEKKWLTWAGGERERDSTGFSLTFFFSSSSSLCLAEDSVSCENPGLPDNGYQIMSKSLYLPGQSLTFVCYQGYELIGEVAIKCILGNPSFWSGPLPLCRGEIFAETFFCGMCFACVDWEPQLFSQPFLYIYKQLEQCMRTMSFKRET